MTRETGGPRAPSAQTVRDYLTANPALLNTTADPAEGAQAIAVERTAQIAAN